MEPTHSEVLRKKAIRTFFINNFSAAYPVYFEILETYPEGADEWMVVTQGPTGGDTLAKEYWQIALFCRNDTTGLGLSGFRDIVADKLVDFAQTDGRLRIPVVDETETVIFSLVIDLQEDLQEATLGTGTKYKILPFLVYWGRK